MKDITVVGIDLAKTSFQVHAEDSAGNLLHSKKLSRNKFKEYLHALPSCLIGMEACGTAHYWAREAQSLGHEVKLINPVKVKAYVTRNKTDARDAEAIAEATRSKKVHSVVIKTVEQQHLTTLHRARSQVVKRRTQLVNHLRSLLAEYGLITAKGFKALRELVNSVINKETGTFPDEVTWVFKDLLEEWQMLNKRLDLYKKQVEKAAQQSNTARKLLEMPGVGEITATAVIAKIDNVDCFRKAKDFAASLGLTPREYSSANTRKMGKISKQGDRYIRTLLIHGARTSIQAAKRKNNGATAYHRWVLNTVERIGFNKAAVALANKHARIIWAITKHQRDLNLNHAEQYN